MKVPAELRVASEPNSGCRLVKALYGLRQAPRLWYAETHYVFTKVFKLGNCPYELCLYTTRKELIFLCTVLYLNEPLIASSSCAKSLRVKTKPSSHFKKKEVGPARQFLGIQTTRERPRRSLFLLQSFFVDKFPGRFEIAQDRPVNTPVEVPGYNSSPPNPEPFFDNTTYRFAIGSLMYPMLCMRPDIASAVENQPQQYKQPSVTHWKAVKRVYRYVWCTKDMGTCLIWYVFIFTRDRILPLRLPSPPLTTTVVCFSS